MWVVSAHYISQSIEKKLFFAKVTILFANHLDGALCLACFVRDYFLVDTHSL